MNRRWRKKYKGQMKYFGLLDGETKTSSYQRCWRECQRWMRDVDASQAGSEQDAARQQWAPILNAVREAQQRTIDLHGDTEETRAIWQDLESTFVAKLIRPAISQGQGIAGDDAITSLIDDRLKQLQGLHWQPPATGSGNLVTPPKQASGTPPWEQEEEISGIHQLIEKFLTSVKVKRSERRAANLKQGIDEYLKTLPSDVSIDGFFSSDAMRSYRDAIEARELSASRKRDLVAPIAQFARWAHEGELIDVLPRIVSAEKMKVSVSTDRRANPYADGELRKLLKASSGRSRLYLLLALNCGFTQKDISDLKSPEVDLKKGQITRKRSKTGDHGNVPTVTWRLWPETLALLKEHVSGGDRVLVNEAGRPLVQEKDGKRTADAVKKAMDRLRTDTKRKDPITFKRFRPTAATKLHEGPHAKFTQYFLDQSPKSVADQFYVQPNQRQFNEAVSWLRTALKIDQLGE
ncbi:tyrosine-type recombinase/integrase [Roseiconus nitratireducens]|nr:tyrosine-type recombinase/integrase [Roseiconus nitratireducens]